MALIKAVTFESGTFTGTDGFDSSINGEQVTIETTNPIVGTYHAAFVAEAPANARQGIVSVSLTDWHIACYFRLLRAPDSDTSIITCRSGPVAFRGSVTLTTSGTLVGVRSSSTNFGESDPLEIGKLYRIEFFQNTSDGMVFRLAEGDGSPTVIGTAARIALSSTEIRFGVRGSQATGTTPQFEMDECRVDDAEVPALPAPNPDAPAQTEITATTLLQPVATLTIQQPTRIAASTLIEPVASLALATPTRIAATTLIQPVASLTISADAITRIAATTLVLPVASLTIAQQHLIRASTLLSLVARMNLAADDATRVRPVALIQPVATLAIEQRHHISAVALITPISALAIAQHHHIRAVTLLRLVAYDNYTGPGTGLVVPGARFSPNALREGDTFRVVLPWAGISGMTGLAHVNSRTLRDDRAEQDVDLHITALDQPNIPALAGGARPVATADQQDYARKQARQGREIDRLERNRQG